MKVATALLLLCLLTPAADEAGRIMSPVDRAAFASGPVRVIATAPAGRLEIDGMAVPVENPYPNVVTAQVDPAPGQHKLALVWAGGRQEITIAVGPDVPAGYQRFRAHPPGGDASCTKCHGLSQRGRFIFKGGCFECHSRDPFAKVHTHTADVLNECGLCHNAHGSTGKAHLTLSKDLACRQCHN